MNIKISLSEWALSRCKPQIISKTEKVVLIVCCKPLNRFSEIHARVCKEIKIHLDILIQLSLRVIFKDLIATYLFASTCLPTAIYEMIKIHKLRRRQAGKIFHR